MGDSITEGTINEWKVGEGEYAEVDDVILIIDTDKVSIDITTHEAGTVTEHKAAAGDVVEVGAPLYVIQPGDAPEGGGKKKKEKSEDSSPPPKKEDKQEEKKETKKDDKATKPTPGQEKAKNAPSSSPPSGSPPPSSQSSSKSKSGGSSSSSSGPSSSKDSSRSTTPSPHRQERRVPMTRLRQRVSERLKDAQNTAAMLTTFNECDMGDLMALRSEMNEAFMKKHGCKIGFVSAFMLAATKALQAIPAVNAYIEEKEIVYKDYVDMSVAVATPNGLMVPVIRDCQDKGLPDLEKSLAALAVKARDGKITLEDMAGGSFTISNGGVFGSMLGTPIINPPQSSILGLHSIVERPVAKNGQVVIRPIMYLALTYDHRLIDGREAVTFLKTIRDYVQDPRTLLLDM